ncbi:hypothetical protein GOP47_0000833 [Adiantum capillus-veneris]|uniref:SAC domain-containing protein n=1 Tax=Adiantum capillus-veneris TaxID=13818 RepID=A0A9D4VEM1_ADICA|nr:hypothetical protein GOP47_0000833 [Adiantum capillus-veneris]
MTHAGHGYGETESSRYYLQNMKLYETQTRYYLIGRDKSRSRWRVLKIDRSEPSELNLFEDPGTYTSQDIKDLLSRLGEGNRSCGGVNFVTKAYGIVGFVKFLKPYYMILITKREQIGAICGHSIYGIRESKLLRIPHRSVLFDSISWKIEERYKKLFNSIDLSKDFFYSHTYRIMWSLQKNVFECDSDNMPFDDMFVWNSFITREFRNQLYSPHWTVALVHGFYKQVRLHCEEFNGTLTLVARRSRHFAGTRYLKRGVNAKGRVANDVETEQIVYAESTDQIASVVQHRGSIPLFWSQETSVLTPKPDISLHKIDPTYEATKLHFENLAARYGNPIVILNLVKTKEKRPREVILCREFANAVAIINHGLPKNSRMKFIQCDMHMFMRSNTTDLQDVLESIASEVVDTVGFYYSEKASENANLDASSANALKDPETCGAEQPSVKRSFQHGVLRSNCIDCLDRTNVSQYAFGLVALGQQLHQLGVDSMVQISRGSCIFKCLMEMYNQMGDVIALQYGGSPAHNKVFLRWQGKSNATIQPQEFLRSLMRHYSNAVLDGERQDAINLFLGHFRPEPDKLALWEMDSDNHLQIRRAGNDPTSDLRLSFKRSHSTGDLGEQNEASMTSSQIASEVNSIPVQGPSISFPKVRRRGSTISEAELKKCLPNDCVISEVMASSIYKSTDSSQGSADADWLSSSGNSSEDVQDRMFLTMKTNPDTEPDNRFESDEYFKDFSYVLPNTKSNRLQEREKQDCLLSEHFVNWIQEGDTLCF